MVLTRDNLRCIHRHRIESHPACFAQGKVLHDFKNDAEFERVLGVPWYQTPGYKIGYLDIEVAGGFNADWGTMLSWAIKAKDGDTVYDVVSKKELFNYKFDKRIVQSLIEEMRKYRILCGYYSTGFDMPYIRIKAIRWELDFPGFTMNEKHNGNFQLVPEIYHWDIYYTIKHKLKLSRSSLANACDYFGIEGKTPIKKDVWRKAMYGDKVSLEEVVEHNIEDVKITELLHNKVSNFRKWTRKGI